MRESLKKSLDDNPNALERYPRGSVVLCNACARPIFKLDRSICVGDKVGQSASAYKPLDAVDLAALQERIDVDAGVRSTLRAQTPAERAAHLAGLEGQELRTGEPMMCPLCKASFVQVLAVTKHEVLDKAYTVELLIIPPPGWGEAPAVRGLRLGYGRDWVH